MEEKLLVFTQIVRTAQTEARTEGLEEETSSQDRELDRMVPMIIILSCLITVLVFVMIVVTLVKKSPEYGKNLQTHVAFNKNLDVRFVILTDALSCQGYSRRPESRCQRSQQGSYCGEKT